MLRTTRWDEMWTHALVVRGFGWWFRLVAREVGCNGMDESEFGRRGGDGIYWEGEWCFLAVMRFPDEISCFFVALVRFLDEITWFCCRILSRDLRTRYLGFLPLWDVLAKFVAFGCIFFRRDILMRGPSFWPLWVVLIRCYAFWCTLFVREIVIRCHALLGRLLQALRMRFHNACLSVMRYLDEIACFLAVEYSFWWCDVNVRTVERWRMLKDAGDWVCTMVYWRLRDFVRASWVVRWRGKWM